jgi:hypothetical protein
MVFPAQQLTVLDPGLGQVAVAPNAPLFTGHALGGSLDINTLYSFSSLSTIRSSLGYGVLAEDVARGLQERGAPILVMMHEDDSTALSDAAMVVVPGGGPAITIDGTPRDIYTLKVKITKAGALGVAEFQFTLDAHDSDDEVPWTWSQVRVVPGSGTYVVPNSGLTLTFASGTYVVDAVYTSDELLPPEITAGNLSDVTDALVAVSLLDFSLWNLGGSFATETDASGIASAFQGHLSSLANSFRYARGFVDIGSGDTSANVLAEAAEWTGVRVCPSYGFALVTSALPFEGFATRKVSCSSLIGIRASGSLISTDQSRTASGALTGIRKIYFDGYYDQQLDASKISTLRTFPGIPGIYIANAKLKSSFGSDFTDLQYGRLMDRLCRTVYFGQFPFISEGWRTTTTGAMDPLDAADINSAVNEAIKTELLQPSNARGRAGHVSDARYAVDESWNITQTGQLKTSAGMRPLGYSKEFLTDLFFTLTP